MKSVHRIDGWVWLKISFRVLISVTRPLSKETTFQSLYPELIELKVSPLQWINTKASSFRDENGKLHSKELDDMAPFLPDHEIEMNRLLAKKI
jgi:hypothetical protein